MAFPSPEEFEYQRQVIREAFPQPFEAVEQQLVYVAEHVDAMRPVERRLYDLVLKAHLARCTKTALGIVRECEHGFGELAMSSLRVLAEGVVSAYFVSLDPDARAEQFAAYEELERVEVLRLVHDLEWLDEPELEVPEALLDEERVAEVRARFPNPLQGWFQLPMKRVVAEIEPLWGNEAGRREFRQAISIVRFFGNRHSHLGAYDTGKYLATGDEGVLALQFGPGKAWVSEALVTAAWFYGQMFDLAAEHFELPDIEEWRSRVRVLMSRCRVLDVATARGVGRNDPCPCGSGLKFKQCHLDILK